MTNEDLDMILNAGLEKIAYEEGLNDYADSLEKVAGVHGVDAMDLHDFLEKAAEVTELNEGAKQKMKDDYGRVSSLGVGALGAGAGGLTGLQLKGAKGALAGGLLGGAAGGITGRILGRRGAGKAQKAVEEYLKDPDTPDEEKKSLIQSYKRRNEQYQDYNTKTAGIDDDTLNYLFEKGLEALTE